MVLSKDSALPATEGFMGAMLAGIASRSAATSRVHRLYRDGYASEEEFSNAVKEDAEGIASKQSEFAYVSYGQLDWLDIFRPIARSFSGFSSRLSSGEDAAGPVTRWFRTNTFYRKPLVSGKINCRGSELADSVPLTKKPGVIFLPAPYSLSKMVENTFYGSLEDLAMDYSSALSKSMPALAKKGYRCALLLDHLVGYEQSKDAFKAPDWYADSLPKTKSAGVKVGVHYPSAVAVDTVPLADSADIDIVGIDAVFDAEPRINTRKDLLIGLVDSARVGVESDKGISDRLRKIVDKATFSGRYHVGPSDRLYDVPFEVALQKIETLSRVKKGA